MTRHFGALLLLVTAAGLLIRLWAATAVPVGYDEFWHVFIARNLPREIRSLAHPPLFILLLRAADALVSSTWAYRIASLASGTIVVALFGHILRKIGVSAPIALAGALGAAVSSSLVHLSVVVEAYMLCAAFVLAAFSFGLGLLGPRPPVRSRVGFALFASLALCSHYAAGLFLAATVLAALGLRPRAPGAWRGRVMADLATLALPAATGAGLYVILARPYVRALNHLPTFYFDAARETVPEFLWRNFAATAAILLPAPDPGPVLGGMLLALFLALALLLAAPSAEGPKRSARRASSRILLLLLLLGMAAAILGKYPFGGMMRHQMLLLLFAPLAAWVALDTACRRARSSTSRVAALALGLAGVAASGTLTAREIAQDRQISWDGAAALESDFGSESVVHLDQFNLIGFFMETHDGRWRYLGPLGPPGVEAYKLEWGGRERTLIAHRGRWNMDFTETGAYRDIAAAGRLAGWPCGVLLNRRQLPYETVPKREQIKSAARQAGLELGRTELTPRVFLGRLCVAEETGFAPPRIDRVVPSSVRAGVPFQVQPDGSSALSIEGAGFRPGVFVMLADRPLITAFGNSGWITATVPPELTRRAGRLELRVVDPGRGSSSAVFEVVP
jgi:hypothetical protein